MTSSKPYLIRGLYDWIVDNDLTPYLLVNAEAQGVQVPQEHVVDGKIVLNISPQACRGLHLDNDRIVFTTRFSGQTSQISLTPGSVLAIYAKENGRGMEFEEEEEDTLPPPTSPSKDKGGRKPALKLVK
ncbi:ClpXP protease specificity-enhancing factor [Legionella impletisoli]